jgi:hypothetical protein
MEILGKVVKYMIQNLILVCNQCANNCYSCFQSCLDEFHCEKKKKCLKILMDCALICEMTATLLSLNSQFIIEQISVCEKVCLACATECENFFEEYCLECQNVCRECYRECEKFMENIVLFKISTDGIN